MAELHKLCDTVLDMHFTAELMHMYLDLKHAVVHALSGSIAK